LLITKKCILTGKENTLDLPVTKEQIELWQDGLTIQKAMPNLNDSQREFIMTGILDDVWDKVLTPEETVGIILNPKRDD